MFEYHSQPWRISCFKYLCLLLLNFVRYVPFIHWKRGSVTIESLPAELLYRVTGYLDCNSILSLKLTSKLFCALINSHKVWYGVARKLEGTIGTRLEEEPEAYSSEELQRWCLRRVRASSLWRIANPSMLHDRKCQLNQKGTIVFCRIIPGGRWLIVVTWHGFIYYIDLDSPERRCQELTSLGREGDTICAIWVDDSKRRLSFRISVTDQERKPSSIDIYQVDLVGHGTDADLVAKHLSNLTSPRPCYSATLNGHYYIDRYTTKKTRGIRIFHYEDAPACDDEETPHMVLQDPCCAGPSQFLSFITTFCFVVHTRDSLEFFIITPSHDSHKPAEVNAIFSIAVPAVNDMRISPPYHSPHATRIVLFAENKFKGIYIPHNNPENSTITMLGEYDSDFFRMLGMNCSPSATVVIQQYRMDFIHYEWNSDGMGVIFQVQRYDIPAGSYARGALTFGDEVCRMVFYECCNDPDVIVLDGKCVPPSTSQVIPATSPPLPTLPECRAPRPSWMSILPSFLHSWPRIINWKRETSAIESLPPELLQEIIAYLDWKSIVSLKQASKSFFYATNSRLIWSPIVHELESTTGARLEEEMEDYTGEELQEWCLQRHRASTVWKTTDDYLFPCTEYDLITQGRITFTRIIPGGRWMIAATNLGFIYDIDLNSSERKCHELINLERTEQHLYAIGVDHSKRRLSFRISATETNPAPYRVRIYQVDLVGHGPNARLTATLLSAFSSRRPSDGTALNNNYYIEQFSTQNPMMKLRLFHYHEDCEEPKCVCAFETPRCVAKKSLFFDFITPFWFAVHMQSMLQFCVITPYENSFKPRSVKKVFGIGVSVDPNVQISLPFRFPHETRIISFAKNNFIGISIPHNDPLAHTITQLGKYSCEASEFTMHCGLSNTFVVRDLGEKVDTIRHEWSSGDDGAASFEVKRFEHYLFSRTNIVLDEEMCRIILYGDISAEFFYVLDGTPRR